jgi:hypothetical protein
MGTIRLGADRLITHEKMLDMSKGVDDILIQIPSGRKGKIIFINAVFRQSSLFMKGTIKVHNHSFHIKIWLINSMQRKLVSSMIREERKF